MDSTNSSKYISQGHVFAILLILLWGLVLTFVGYQYTRERQYKVKSLNTQLQQLNLHLADELNVVGSPEELYRRNAGRFEGLRISLIDSEGYISYDSNPTTNRSYSRLNNPEVQEAIHYGHGFHVNTEHVSEDRDFIYSATKLDTLIIRSSLPYEVSLAEVFSVSNIFLAIAIVISILISVIGYITARLYYHLKQAAVDLEREHTLKEREEQEKIRIKRQLTNNINHELKTPICSILGYLDMIINNPNLTHEQIISFSTKSYDQAERLRHLMSDLSTITRIDEAGVMIEREDVDVSRMVEDLIDDVCPQALQQSISVVNALPEGVVVCGNSSLLYSIFRNLVDNAIAYSGGRKVWVELLHSTHDIHYFVVRDNGIGIEEKHLEYIFERFYRVDKGRSRKMGGTGLGLSIVKNAVLFHGGAIEARLSPKGGVEFHFSLKKE
ncbi:MAG: HAMP domain-containing sensor histidine kinase [Rikenellaceae bacterium]